jgi:uncharacterized protein YbbC (DUF1343 family)
MSAGGGEQHERGEANSVHRHGFLIVMLGVVTACGTRPPEAPAPVRLVRPGIEVLLSDSLHLVQGQRVGLVSNQAGVDASGRSDVERLLASRIRLVALFSPEHGFRGSADPGQAVASATDSATGLPIYSLYGKNTAPTHEMLAGLDVILVDLHDAGARYYTYLSTTIEVMRAAAREGKTVLILDRPNPIGGETQGNVLDTAWASFVGRLAVPMRHGMTLGELALLANTDLCIGARLIVAPAVGWKGSMSLDQTGLPFVPPSPNLKTLEALFHYPGLCLFEGTNLSVGRGTDAPFEQVGAPWLDTTRVLARIRAAGLPGVSFRGVTFAPRHPGDGKFADTLLTGIRLSVTRRAGYDPTLTAVHLLAAIRDVHPGRLRWVPAHFDRLAGTDRLRTALEAGRSAQVATAEWRGELEDFRRRQAAVLLYPR